MGFHWKEYEKVCLQEWVSVRGRLPVLSVVCLFPVSLSAGPAAGWSLSAQLLLSGSSPHRSVTWYLEWNKCNTNQNNYSIQLHFQANSFEEKKKERRRTFPIPYLQSRWPAGQPSVQTGLSSVWCWTFQSQPHGVLSPALRCKASKMFEPAISIWKHPQRSVNADISEPNNWKKS